MGVLGLWDVLESVGHPIKVEGLEGKVLGVDANIWLYKFIRGFREKDNATSIESHKLGLFNRVSKLLYYRIKPIFVFDGPAPALKRRTLERRQNVRNKHLDKVQDTAMKILANQLKAQYPDADIDDIRITLPELRSNNLVAAEKLTDEDRALFYLPDTGKLKGTDSESTDLSDSDSLVILDDNFQTAKVDIDSKDFQELPAEMRYEILHDIKSERKRIRNPESLPEDANSFSNFQLERLKARRNVQEKIEKCEQEICINYTGELADGSTIQAFRVQSDATATILYRNNTYDPKALAKQTKEENVISISRNCPVTEPNLDLPTSVTSNLSRDGREKERVILHRKESERKGIHHFESLSEDSNSDIQIERLEAGHSFQEKIEKCEQEICNNYAPKLAEVQTIQASQLQSDVATTKKYCDSTYDHTNQDIQAKDTSSSLKSADESNDDAKKLYNHTIVIEESASDDSSAFSSDEQFHPVSTKNIRSEKHTPDQQQTHNSNSDVIILDLLSEDSTSALELSTESNQTPQTLEQSLEAQRDLTIDLESDDHEKIHNLVPEDSIAIDQHPRKTQSSQESVEQSQILSDKNPTTNEVRVNYRPPTPPRATNRVTNKIIEEAKELLRLFGVPYIDAAGEAEAQCAKLEELKLTEGTITDDSDIWLFGAQNVFRYFFSDDKYVMQYKMTDIQFHIRMTRENLVCFAMLVGSDYTDGIKNVGPVTALEILSEFPGDDMKPLIDFCDWHKEAVRDKKAVGDKKRRKLLKFKLPEEFPSRAVYEGYSKPVADMSSEKFTWGMPELDELREYARRNFGWEPKKVDEKLLPVLKRLNERKLQKTIDTFFFKTQANRNPDLFRSKRVNQALNKIAKRAARGGEGSRGSMPAASAEVVNLSEDDD